MTSIILIYIIMALLMYIQLDTGFKLDTSRALRAAGWPIDLVRWAIHKIDESSKHRGGQNNA